MISVPRDRSNEEHPPEAQAERILCGSWIPPIDDEELLRRFDKIKPVIEGRYWVPPRLNVPRGEPAILLGQLRGTSYLWDPEAGAISTRSLVPLVDITTYHTYGAPSLFKPSVAEVLAQISEKYLDEVVAFEIVESPESAADLNRERTALNAGYHVATTRLYRRKK